MLSGGVIAILQPLMLLIDYKINNQKMPMSLVSLYIQSNLSYVTFQGKIEIWSHKTGGRLIQV